jgi:transposase InsO family protein
MKPLELIHTFIFGPTIIQSLQGENYFLFFIDDYSRMIWVTFQKKKSEAFEKFKAIKSLVENEIDLKIKCLISDREGEFSSNEFEEFCELHGIKRHFLAARTPNQNGVVERKNQTIQEMARTMLNETNLSDMFWREAINTIVYILHKGKIRVNNNKTPYELWKGRPTTIKYFKCFGSK